MHCQNELKQLEAEMDAMETYLSAPDPSHPFAKLDRPSPAQGVADLRGILRDTPPLMYVDVNITPQVRAFGFAWARRFTMHSVSSGFRFGRRTPLPSLHTCLRSNTNCVILSK